MQPAGKQDTAQWSPSAPDSLDQAHWAWWRSEEDRKGGKERVAGGELNSHCPLRGRGENSGNRTKHQNGFNHLQCLN